METIVYTKSFDAPKVDRNEILRYARVGKASDVADALLSDCLRDAEACFSYKTVYAEFPVKIDGDAVSLGFASCASASLARALSGCKSVVLFTATVGAAIDRLIKRYALLSPSKAQMLHAVGTERVESLCDAFCAFMAEEKAKAGCALRPRVSPGYGDIPLSIQNEIFVALDPQKRLGVALGQSLLMSPSKSVTALIGVFDSTERKEMPHVH